ncbi:nitrogen fixation protein of unknown function [Clostridium homopropionicum DSM 5847]|uniref:Nif11 domain-containing protein n=2 Tax=Clostridium TaxID=1485 RepID=A0A0L6ZAS8_9CLOT|nr:Nif11-like leader peptide family RiPP precursor [Clostridium homopropionicum]KOA20070.1 nitrogen fixation protein of unknown function [Clostridium homopropionicum DSM 5847]SFG85829.1 nif11-like leader peptide domain-containing protein [Clostridium homopropionicum]
MSDPVEQFVTKSKEDPAFLEKVSRMKTREEVICAAKTEGIQLTVEDIDAINEALRKENLNTVTKMTPAIKFISKMIENKNFAELVMLQTEIEEVLRIANEVGISITVEDLFEVNKTIAALSVASPTHPSYGQLSEEDLEQVAGGFLNYSITESIVPSATFSITSVTALSSLSITASVDFSAASTLTSTLVSYNSK